MSEASTAPGPKKKRPPRRGGGGGGGGGGTNASSGTSSIGTSARPRVIYDEDIIRSDGGDPGYKPE
jgi:hypothetical protein